MSKCNAGFIEGYTDNGSRNPIPYNPNTTIVEEIVQSVVVKTSAHLTTQTIVNTSVTTSDGDLMTSETFNFIPTPLSYMYITINGITVLPANGASEQYLVPFYITDSTNTTVRPNGSYFVGDLFHWNGSVAGYQLDASDDIKLIYEV